MDLTPDYIEGYQDGQRDCIAGKPKSANPYRASENEEKRQGWKDGWEAAARGE